MRRGGGSRRKSKDQSEMEEKKKKDKRGHTKRTRRKRWELPQMGVLNSIPSIGYLQDIGRGGGGENSKYYSTKGNRFGNMDRWGKHGPGYHHENIKVQ